MRDELIYLDHNATTPVLGAVVEAMLPYLREHFGNPSSGHGFGQGPRVGVRRAREQVAGLLGCDADEVVFTSGGTEANNLAIRGVCGPGTHIVTSVIEHPATARPCAVLQGQGHDVTAVPVDEAGRVRVEDIRAALRPSTSLVTVMHANNETGVLQPIREIAEAAREVGALTHTDAAQSVGKVAVDHLGVDLLSLAGHKLYAPKGVGALYVRRGTKVSPLVVGAGHEFGLRPGTENVASIVGLGEACEIVGRDLVEEAARVAALRDELWRRLAMGIDGLQLNGHADRLPNTLNVRLPGVLGAEVLDGAPIVAASTGSACHEGAHQASPVILAMGVPHDEALGSLRLTLGRGTTHDEVVRAAAAICASWRRTCPA